MSKVRVNTSAYQTAHGKTPRGFGTWVFSFGKSSSGRFEAVGTYSECKQEAVKVAQEMDFQQVNVLA